MGGRNLKAWLCLAFLAGFAGQGFAANLSRPLQTFWQFRKAEDRKWLPAQVPGTVHTDLYTAGTIPDPFFGGNEQKLAWVENATWEYRAPISLSPQEAKAAHKVLEFQGLDTYADVYVNGKLLLEANNMFRTWEVDVSKVLTGRNDSLRIIFHPPSKRTAKEFAARPYRLPADNDASAQPSSTYSRKAAYHFGWDWAPRLVTAGIWRPIVLHTWDRLRIEEFSPQTLSLLPNMARLKGEVRVQVESTGTFQFAVTVDGKQVYADDKVLWNGPQALGIPFEIMSPKLWWPAGAGAPNRYKICLRVSENGQLIDSMQVKTGLRTVELHQEPDAKGSEFAFSVNGRRIFMRGTNYVPSDMFLPKAQYNRDQIFKAMQAVNMNMVRVWGGGIYEDEEFYANCDSLGILVWQDFMFAGGMYPFDDPAFKRNVEAEVTQQVQRLRKHPCVAMYCGNNEIEVAWFNWGWQAKYGINPSDSAKLWNEHQGVFTEMIPGILAQLHPGMPYIPSSPTSNWGHPDRFLTGNMHDWSVWHGGDNIDTLRAHVPRFATEYGFQSYPAFNTLELYSTEQDRVMGSEWMQQRQKSYKGNAPILSEVARLYGSPKDFASFLALSQIVQAQALENAVETHRTYRPQCMGSLYWQMNDCWPGPSWSTVDYLGRWKAGHFALKRLFAPVLVAVEEDGKDVVVRMASDLPYPKEATMQLRLKSFTGIILGQQDKVISIPADSSCEVFRLPLTRLASRFDRKTTLLEAVVHAGGKAIAGEAYYFVSAKDMKLPDAEFSYGVVAEGDHFVLSVEAKHLLKDVEIRVQGCEAEFSDNFMDFLPGRKYEILIRHADVADAEDLIERLRFRDLGKLLEYPQ